MARLLLRFCIAVAVLMLAFPVPIAAATPAAFPDVPPDASFAEAVQQLVARGIVRGYPDGRFGPDDPLLRAQTAVTIVRAMGLTGQPASGNFGDQGETDDESWSAVRLLADRNVARGFPDGTFQPTGLLTRQQAISFISRAMVALGDWQPQEVSVPYDDVAPAHIPDVATYGYYVGTVPETSGTGTMGADSVASRGWYAEALWPAVNPARKPVHISSSPVPVPSPSATPTSAPLFGTLLSDEQRAVEEYGAGVRIVHLELGWDHYEPQEGVFNTAYAADAQRRLRAFQAAGMQVILGIGLQYPPAWVYSYPNSRYVNQYGTAAGAVNLTFNQALRDRATRYINRVAADLGPSNFWAVRIGAGGYVEAIYPSETEGGNTNGYWAYDALAQGAAGRPASIPPTPYPGWRPGQKTYNGQAFTTAQVQTWYDWYLGAMVDGVNWQVAAYKAAGYTGFMQVLIPGLGSRPYEYQAAIADYLNGKGDTNQTMGRAAVWDKVIDRLSDRARVMIYVSSMADGSGGNDLCQATDQGIARTDPQVSTWSATRWISYNADRYGLPKMGENPGRSDTNSYGPAMMSVAAAQMRACGMQGLMWAHAFNLYDGTSGIALGDYAAVIRQYVR